MELREKLLRLKSENGYTTDALSERSGVPKGTINKLLNGETRNPTAQTLKRLANALNCPLEELCGPAEGGAPTGDSKSEICGAYPRRGLQAVGRAEIPEGGAPAPTSDEDSRAADPAVAYPRRGLQAVGRAEIPGVYRLSEMSLQVQQTENRGEWMRVEMKKIPVLGGIAAGKPIFCEEELEIAACPECAGCDLALRVKGDSMTGARIHDGDIVFIRRQDDVDDGQIAAVVIDDTATLKRVYHVPNGLQLLSENPKYAPMLVTLSEHDSIRILGRAVGFQSLL